MSCTVFYVRPRTAGGYGRSDGSSYENAWNGLEAVDWDRMSRAGAATLRVCGEREEPSAFVTVFVEKSYLETAPRPHPRRELTEPV
ncbi:MAG: hypothetical protein ACT4P4_29915 [Betaproteobacteria bacterium]